MKKYKHESKKDMQTTAKIFAGLNNAPQILNLIKKFDAIYLDETTGELLEPIDLEKIFNETKNKNIKTWRSHIKKKETGHK